MCPAGREIYSWGKEVLSFSKGDAQKILNGEKTETRRFWRKCRVSSGSLQQAKCDGGLARPFAVLRIEGVYQEALAMMSEESIKAEGYDDQIEFLSDLLRSTMKKKGEFSVMDIAPGRFGKLLERKIWVVKFLVVERLVERV